MLVKEWMSKKIWTIEETRSMRDAKEMMMEHKVRRLPVVAGDILIGIITKEDILAASPSIVDFKTTDEIRRHLDETYVAAAMTEDPYTVGAMEPIESAAKIMAEKKIGSLPVLDGSKLVGLLTETDIFRAFVKILGLTTDSDRVVFEAENAKEALEKMMETLQTEGTRVLSVVNYDSPKHKGHRRVVVRLAAK
jgi:acetoin utilization protein AcuB